VPGSEENAMDGAPGAATELPEEAALRLEARRLIEARIDALPERLRTVFVLGVVMSADEAAASAFAFDGARCDRIVAAVLARV